MDKTLVIDDLGNLQNDLHGISSKWHNLGVQLHIEPGDLDNIKTEVITQVECLREMLKIWLKQIDPYPTKIALVKALKRPVINEQRLAQQLQEKYTTDVATTSASDIQSASGSHTYRYIHCLVLAISISSIRHQGKQSNAIVLLL